MSKTIYDPERLRELFIKSLGDNFIDYYVMDLSSWFVKTIFVKVKEEVDWEQEISVEGLDFVTPYFEDELGSTDSWHIIPTLGLKGEFIYVKE
ncbi:MAG: hypothetical protein FWG68_12755 [Defluviitaleaceae bacterium]|nr:hypothetical protein [Defluviitaleaceae bacterium]